MNKKMMGFLLPLLVLAIGGTLYATGKLPFGVGENGVALADTNAAGSGATELDSKDDEDKKTENPPVPVELALVEGRGIAAYYRAASVIEADRMVDLVSRTLGRVDQVTVEEGDWVEEGFVLAELENAREKIQLKKANLALEDKERQLQRSEKMLTEQLISRQEFDDVESAWKLAEAERDLARIALEETRIRAPFSGQVTSRMVVPGQQVVGSQAVFTLGDFSPLRVRVHLPEEVALKVSAGQRVLVSPESVVQPLEAVVERISPVVDPGTSTVRLTLLLAEDVTQARVGGFVKVRITTDRHQDALAIPKIALVEEGALRSVFVAEADTVRKVEVQTGLYDESHVEVVEGLFAGDFVVTMGQGGLRTGSPIRALNGLEIGYKSSAETDSDPAKLPDTVTVMAELE
ncbi:MAG: efflux RND transporter periplasmic adaptor subunit [Gemmatimonadales bacterium]|nr:efflux RND transporter periplasmic adaptor subunit [Gemmatimonadales bacterium]